MRLHLLIIVSILALCFSSCKKEYNCICTGKHFLRYNPVKATNEKQAGKKCTAYELEYPADVEADCYIK